MNYNLNPIDSYMALDLTATYGSTCGRTCVGLSTDYCGDAFPSLNIVNLYERNSKSSPFPQLKINTSVLFLFI